jgi:hypothetical protein
VGQGPDIAGVSTAAGGLACDDGAFARLQVVRELLGGGKPGQLLTAATVSGSPPPLWRTSKMIAAASAAVLIVSRISSRASFPGTPKVAMSI